MNILITGATGLVGRKLGIALKRKGHRIFVVSRNKERAQSILPFPAHIIEGDLNEEALHDERLSEIDAVVHLAGEGVADGRWTEARKKRIYDSRVQGLNHLIQSLKGRAKLKAFISASAIGYYGDQKNKLVDESSDRGRNFLSQVCQDWEAPLLTVDRKNLWPDMRALIFRIGVVLSNEGGALPKMLEPFRLGVAGVLGSGEQWMSWIHLDDLVNLFVEALENQKMEGIYNAVAPEPVTNRRFSMALSFALRGNKRLGPPVPEFALKLALGEMAQVVLDSQRVRSRLASTSFAFKYPSLDLAMANIFESMKNGVGIYSSEQYLPYKIEQVFKFFCDAQNLEKITPPQLNFNIKDVSTPQIQEGTLIAYNLKIRGVPVNWLTKIGSWNPPFEFSDEQLKGPYTKWFHTHRFEALGEGTLMTDRVLYKLPMGKLGKLVAGGFVASEVQEIFSYRRKITGSIDFSS